MKIASFKSRRAFGFQQPGNDFQPFFEADETLLHIQQIKAEQGMLASLPACPHSQRQPTAGEIVYRRGHARGHRRVPEGHR